MPLENKSIIDKVLESGLVDKATAELMEHFGYIAPGSAEKVNEDKLKDSTKEHLTKLANELAVEVEKENALRETYLDLERIRWPVTINIIAKGSTTLENGAELQGVMDRMGRYYFRIQDVDPSWFAPGFIIRRSTPKGPVMETIWQSQTLYIGEVGVCVQVSVDPEKKEG
jgi:hypothetical protein